MSNRDIGVLRLHWIVPMFWSAKPIRRFLKLFLMTRDIRLCRLLRLRTCWSIHDLVSNKSKDVGWELRIRRRLARHVDRCFVHSQSALGLLEHKYGIPPAAKTSVVRHASVVGQYPAAKPDAVTLMRHEPGLGGTNFACIFLGAIRKCKEIERLIEALRKLMAPDVRLAIVNSVLDPALEAWLCREAAGDRRIVPKVGYVADEALPARLNLASVVVPPFAQNLTSGSALPAMSFSKPLSLPDAARVFDSPGKEGAVYFKEGDLQDALMAARNANLVAMVSFNRKEAATRSWLQMAAQTIAVYARKGTDIGRHHLESRKAQQGSV